MKTKAKKLATLILTALLVLSILPMNVFCGTEKGHCKLNRFYHNQ